MVMSHRADNFIGLKCVSDHVRQNKRTNSDNFCPVEFLYIFGQIYSTTTDCTVFTRILFYLVCKCSGSILVVFGQISIEAHLHQSWQFVPAIRNSISSWILTFVLGAYCSFDRGSKELPIHKIWSNFDFIWYRHTSVKVCPQAAKLRMCRYGFQQNLAVDHFIQSK